MKAQALPIRWHHKALERFSVGDSYMCSQSDTPACMWCTPYTLHTVQGCLKHRFRSEISLSESSVLLEHPGKPAFLVSPASKYVSHTMIPSDRAIHNGWEASAGVSQHQLNWMDTPCKDTAVFRVEVASGMLYSCVTHICGSLHEALADIEHSVLVQPEAVRLVLPLE